MDFMKVFDQTVREIKREVNLKVLKVPEIEQKVLDATNDEPWGPHGSALQEIAQATKKFTECQMIMGVLWSRLKDSGPNWRHVYKTLTVIEYLIANGSERAVDDILGRTYQISVLSGFEYVEPNGKDTGINVRKKVETIMALLNDKDKIQAVREKAAANRDKYFGLSSTGITNRSSSTSYGSSSYGSDRYGSQSGSREFESFQDSYKDGEDYEEKKPKWNQRSNDDNFQPMTKEDAGSKFKKGAGKHTTAHDSKPSVYSSKQLNKPAVSPSKTTNVQSTSNEDDFDDFDPRGTSTGASANATSNQVDLFGESLVGDLMDAPPSFPTKPTISETAATSEVDLFADATFQSASPPGEATTETHVQDNMDFFVSQPVFPAKFTSNVEFFATADTGLSSVQSAPLAEATNAKNFDPFASIPLNNFDGSDPFGDFTSNSNQTTGEPTQQSRISSPGSLDETFGAFTSHAGQTNTGTSQHATNINLNVNPSSSTMSKPGVRKDTFQVKSGIWADSLSRGLIDLNIFAPKKVNLADIGIVGGLDDASDEKDKAAPSAAFMGRSMGTGSGLAWSGFPSSTGSGGFSAFGQQEFGNFK